MARTWLVLRSNSSCDAERWNLPFNMLKVVERCWTNIELGYSVRQVTNRFSSLVSRGFVAISTWRPKSWNQLSSNGVLITPVNWSICTRLFRACTIGNFCSLKCPSFWVLPTGCSMLLIWFNFSTIHASKFCGFCVFFLSPLHDNGDNARSAKRQQHFLVRHFNFAPKWVVVAQQKLNEYSTSCNNVSTSRNNVQH